MRKTHLTIILVSFLSAACQTERPLDFSGKQCQTVLSFNDNGELDETKSFCRFRQYSISRDFIGSRGNVTRRPLRDCHECIGYSVRDNTRLVNFYESVRSEINAAEIKLQEGITGETEESARAGQARREYEADQSNYGDYKEAAR